jgi:hypothetical protein
MPDFRMILLKWSASMAKRAGKRGGTVKVRSILKAFEERLKEKKSWRRVHRRVVSIIIFTITHPSRRRR